jgi:PPP family 3-phenylpropionic acid transporter
MLVAALILGSHAMHDAFAVIRWSAAGISPAIASLLWSESVAAEVLVFFVIGPALVTRLTAAGAAALAALAGILRWAVMAQTTEVMVLALVQPLHGITFALLHLACMRLIARAVPPGLEGTAQAIYGTVGIGAATALLTLVSGALYARLGAHGFWVMAMLSALAVPLTWKLKQPEFGKSRSQEGK